MEAREKSYICPTCNEAVKVSRKDNPAYPFCNPQCQLIDAGRWLNEDYKIAGEPYHDVSDTESH